MNEFNLFVFVVFFCLLLIWSSTVLFSVYVCKSEVLEVVSLRMYNLNQNHFRYFAFITD